jgi:acetyltransferase-like isoleucine patch superfamily enzyme
MLIEDKPKQVAADRPIHQDVTIHPLAEVEPGAHIGPGSSVWRFAHVRTEAVIGADCNIGNGCYIDKGAILGDRVRVQNGVLVYNGVVVEDDAFLGPNVTFTNDMYPRAHSRDWTIVPTRVCRGASIGANATIVCGVTLHEHAMVAAGSVVTRDVPPHGLVCGAPARLVGYVCICGQKLPVERGQKPAVHVQCLHCGHECVVGGQ